MPASATSALNQVGIGAYQVTSQIRPANNPARQVCQVSLRKKISTSAATKTENVTTKTKNFAFWTHMDSTSPSYPKTRPNDPAVL